MRLPTRPLGVTGLEVTIVGFGGLGIARLPDEAARQVVRASLDMGVNFFDTARSYVDDAGLYLSSEEKIGEVVSACRDRCYLATKTERRARDEAAADIEASLRRLRTDRIDLMQLHAVDTEGELQRVLGRGGALSALKDAREEGKVRFLGITGHRPDVLLLAAKTGEFASIMVPVNIVDRFVFGAEAVLLPFAADHGLGVLAMKPLAGGALKDEASLALRYVLGQMVSGAVVGMVTPAEVEQNVRIGAGFAPLSPEEEQKLIVDAKALGTEFCRQCGYCGPCPQGIDIPRVFLLEGYHDRYGFKEWARAEYARLVPRGADCVACGDCMSRCPYRLAIPDRLRQAHGKLG